MIAFVVSYSNYSHYSTWLVMLLILLLTDVVTLFLLFLYVVNSVVYRLWARMLGHWKSLHTGLIDADYIGGASHAVFVTKSAVLRSEVGSSVSLSLLTIVHSAQDCMQVLDHTL